MEDNGSGGDAGGRETNKEAGTGPRRERVAAWTKVLGVGTEKARRGILKGWTRHGEHRAREGRSHRCVQLSGGGGRLETL